MKRQIGVALQHTCNSGGGSVTDGDLDWSELPSTTLNWIEPNTHTSLYSGVILGSRQVHNTKVMKQNISRCIHA